MGTFTKMKTFITVIEENSFNRAAAKLYTSGAEISRRISSLEEDLKAKLIERTTRKLTLTKLGEIYYEDCKRILNDVQASNQKILSQQQEPSGELTIHYISSLDLIPKLSAFLQRYPKISLKLHRAERLPDFDKEDIDITIGLSEYAPLPESYVRKRIGMVQNILVASPRYLAQNKPIKNPSDLLSHKYISHTARINDRVLELKDDIAITLSPYLYMNDTEEMIKAALADLGIVYVHEDRMREHLKHKKLIAVLPDYMRAPVNYYMVYKFDRYLDPKVRALLDFYQE